MCQSATIPEGTSTCSTCNHTWKLQDFFTHWCWPLLGHCWRWHHQRRWSHSNRIQTWVSPFWPTSFYSIYHHLTCWGCKYYKLWPQNFSTLETAGTEPQKKDSTNADQKFLETYSQNYITRLEDGSYCARFPWKGNHPPLPSNFSNCQQRTRSLAHRLAQTPNLLQLYDSVIKDQLQRGFIQPVNKSMTTGKVHYIPYHCVKKNSATTPIRVVYDCSCRQSRWVPSFNDCLLQGPGFLNNLCSILLRFHTYTLAMTTDIEKEFLHVHLHEKDKDFTCFFWLANPSDPESELMV